MTSACFVTLRRLVVTGTRSTVVEHIHKIRTRILTNYGLQKSRLRVASCALCQERFPVVDITAIAIVRIRPLPRVIIMRHGQKLPPHSKAVDRRSKWGNPYIVRRDGAGTKDVVRMFACHLLNSDHLLDQLPDLTGWNLGCWDLEWDGAGELPLTCHAPLLLRLANTPDLLENPKPYLSTLCHRDSR